MKYEVKHDCYTENRGGYGKLTNVFCKSCGTDLLLYQKDGPGWLKRMYIDKIIAPQELVKRMSTIKEADELNNLICKTCNSYTL